MGSLWRALFGPGWREVEASERRWRVVAAVALVATVVVLTACASEPVVDVQAIDKPLLVACEAPAVAVPTWALDTVQLTGNPAQDMVLIYRAMEAEIEQRIAYEAALAAAVEACR